MPQPDRDTRDSFAARNGWGWDHLVEALYTVRWLRPDAPSQAPGAILATLQRGARSVDVWAATRGVEPERAYRNLIAGAPADDLPLYRLLLSVPGALPDDLRRRLTAVRDELPSAQSSHKTIEALGLGKPVDEDAITIVLRGSSRRLTEWLVRCDFLAHPGATAGERVAVAMRLAAGERVRFRLQLVKRALNLYPAADPMGPADLAALSRSQVDQLLRWPHLLNTLGKRAAGDGHLDGHGSVSFADEVEAWRETVRFDLCVEVADAIRRRDLTASCFSAFAADTRCATIPSDLEPLFASAIAAPVDGRIGPMHTTDLARVVAALPPDLAGAGRLVLTPTPGRAAVLQSLAGSRLERAVSGVHLTELVATLTYVEPSATRDMAQEGENLAGTEDEPEAPGLSIGDLGAFAASVVGAGRGGELLEALLDADTRFAATPALANVPPEVFGAWLGATAIDTPLLERALLRAGNTVTNTAQAVRNLRAVDPDVISLSLLLTILGTAERRVALEGAAGKDAIELYRDLASRIHDAGWRVEAGPDLDAVFDFPRAAAAMPDAVLDVMGDSGDIVNEPLVAQVSPGALRTHLAGSAQSDAWQQALDQAVAAGTFLPGPLRELTRSDVDLLRRTLEAAPGVLPVEDVVLFGLASPRIGAVVDDWLTPERRRAVLPFIRARYAEHPNLATAYEVATAFSLAYAPYLVALAGRLQLPSPPDRRGRQFDDLYHTYELPKHSGGTRTITAPAKGLKGLQRMLLAQGFHHVSLEAAATGFRPGVSIKDNATAHVGQPVVVNIDIAGFFPHTGYDHILRASRKLCDGQLSERAARFIADICSHQGALPTGAPTSPAIANIVLTRIDRALTTAAASRSVRYTRYADDLTFSGGGHAVTLVPFAGRLLKELGYELDGKKTNIFRRGRRQVVTGLVVNERADLPRHTRRRLRAALYRREHGGTPTWHGKEIDDATLTGWFAFEAMLRPEDGRDGLARLRAIRERTPE